MVMYPNKTYKVKLDNEVKHEGILEDHYGFLLPRTLPVNFTFKASKFCKLQFLFRMKMQPNHLIGMKENI